MSERFWSKVDKSGECWLWTAAKNSSGYGLFVTDGRRISAHRFAYQLANGPIPNGLLCCHRCDTPGCVRPDHIFLGTYRDNTLDAIQKGRMKYSRGPRFNTWLNRKPEGSQFLSEFIRFNGWKLNSFVLSSIRERLAYLCSSCTPARLCGVPAYDHGDHQRLCELLSSEWQQFETERAS